MHITGFGMMGGGKETARLYTNSQLKAEYVDHIPGIFFHPTYLVSNEFGDKIGWIKQHQEMLEITKNAHFATILTGKTVDQANGYLGLEIEEVKSWHNKPQFTESQPTKEKPSMKTPEIKAVVNNNMFNAKNAMIMEGGRIANIQLASIVAKKIDKSAAALLNTPLGHLVIANVASFAAQSFYDQNKMVNKLAQAMMVSAYQEALQELDINGVIAELMSNSAVASVLAESFETPAETNTNKE